MTLQEILSDESLRRREFPVAEKKIFLAHAGDCPLPKRVADEVAEYVQRATTNDQERFVYPQILTDGRKIISGLLNCQPEEVAFVGPTSLALSFVASGLKFRRGDNILVYFDDYPSNVYPWMALAEQGVQVRLMNTKALGTIRDIDVMGQVDENTRLVALASCHFISGWRIDIPKIGKYLRERGILFCVDAIQTFGAFPTPLEYVDFAAGDAHKWMLGPCGAGLMYVRREMQERLNPPIYGWHNVNNPNFVAQEQIEFRNDSRKFEAGTHNLVGLVGVLAGLKLVAEIGLENISAELLRKRAFLVPKLQAKGYTVLNADAPAESASGIVTFHNPGKDHAALYQKLNDANVVASLRTDRTGQNYIRFAPHFYITDGDLSRVLELV